MILWGILFNIGTGIMCFAGKMWNDVLVLVHFMLNFYNFHVTYVIAFLKNVLFMVKEKAIYRKAGSNFMKIICE